MKPWKPVEVLPGEISEDKLYFIVSRHGSAMGRRYAARNSKDKPIWSMKPGLALRYRGGPVLKDVITRFAADYYCVEVPADADKRWRRKGRGQ